MVTRFPASIALALIFPIATLAAVEANPRPAVQPSQQRAPVTVMRPGSAVVLRTEQAVTRGIFSRSTSAKSFAILRPSTAVVLSPRESSPTEGKR